MEADINQKEALDSKVEAVDGGLGLESIELVDEVEVEQSEDGKMLRSWKDIARRARIFEYCKVDNPNEEPVSKDEGLKLPVNGQSEEVFGSESDDGRVQEEDQVESRPRRQSVSNPFNFPQKPIEQIEMLRDEVNLERQSSNEKQPFSRSPSQSIRLQHSHVETILEETENDVIADEAEKLDIPLPLFQRLSLLGDNFSGVKPFLTNKWLQMLMLAWDCTSPYSRLFLSATKIN